MFDEPSSYLDVKQRLNAARTIRGLLNPDVYVPPLSLSHQRLPSVKVLTLAKHL